MSLFEKKVLNASKLDFHVAGSGRGITNFLVRFVRQWLNTPI